MSEKIYTKLKNERKSKSFSQSEVAKYTKLTRQTVGKLESLSYREGSIGNLEDILEVLGLELYVRPLGRPLTLEELNNE